MSYRKIEVDGIAYEYTVGSAYVKVRGLGAALKEDVGELMATGDGDTKKIAVQPADVARWIRSMVSA